MPSPAKKLNILGDLVDAGGRKPASLPKPPAMDPADTGLGKLIEQKGDPEKLKKFKFGK